MDELKVTLEEAKIMIWSLGQEIDKLQKRNQHLKELLTEYFHLPLSISEVTYQRDPKTYDNFLEEVRKALTDD